MTTTVSAARLTDHHSLYVKPKPPTHNPVFNALRALAPPHDWASVTSDSEAPPSRFRVRLKVRHTNYAHIVEVKLPSQKEAEEAWHEVKEWFGEFARSSGA